jgi:putative ABC transport system substrate-binding protein
VLLSHPADIQWQYLRQLLPDARQIAIIYNPKVSQPTFQALQNLAKWENITLKAVKVESRKDLAISIPRLSTQLDALMVLDASVFNSAAIRQLLLFSFRNRIPLVGLSAQWVKAGALYALDWDYYDMGKQAAGRALEILQKHRRPSTLPPSPPRKIRPVYNPKTAEYMKLKLNSDQQNNLVEVTP